MIKICKGEPCKNYPGNCSANCPTTCDKCGTLVPPRRILCLTCFEKENETTLNNKDIYLIYEILGILAGVV